jgi:aspartokinase
VTEFVHAAVAGDVGEAEEIQEILRAAGIQTELQSGEEDSVVVLVPESDLEAAQDAIEAMTEPDDVVAEP